MPSVATIIKMIRQESPARLEMGTVVSVDSRGIHQVTVRLSGGRTISRPYMCVDDLEVGDPVIAAHMEGLDRMVIVSRVLDDYSSDLAKHGVLAPPANLAVTGYPMAIHTEWEDYPGEGLSYIVEESDDGGTTGTQMLVTQGSYYLHLCTVETDHAPETWHFRVRALRWLGDNNVQYSGWSDWTSGTSITWDGRYYRENELSSAACDGLHGASLIWICDADDNFPSTVSDVELALDYLAEAGSTHDLLSATHPDTVAQAVARGDIPYGNATPAWDVLSIGAAATILRSDGTDPAWVNPAVYLPVPATEEGQALVADAALEWIADATPTWISEHTFLEGLSIAAGQTVTMGDGAAIGQATGPLLTFDDTDDELELTGADFTLASGYDVFPEGDGGGLFKRNVNHWRTPTDHFNVFAGWTWDAVTFDGAPSTVNVATYPSLLYLMNDNLAEDHFAYQVVATGSTREIRARLYVGLSSYVGVRLDDGTDDNYYEIRLTASATAGLLKMQHRYRTGGGGVTVADLVDELPPQFYDVRAQRSGTTGLSYLVVNTPIPLYAGGVVTAAWTAIWIGPIFGQRGIASSADRAGLIDWVEIA